MWKGIVGKPFSAHEFAAYVDGLHFDTWHPRFIVVHNTSAPTLAQWHGTTPAAQRIKNLESYYRYQQHWTAGPHLFIADDFIWTFTPMTTPGVHSPSWNAVSLGFEIVGEYDVEAFAGGVRDNAVAALGILHRKLHLDPADYRLGVKGMHFHKEDPRTTHKDCPGKHVDKADLLKRVQCFMAAWEMPTGEHLPNRPAGA